MHADDQTDNAPAPGWVTDHAALASGVRAAGARAEQAEPFGPLPLRRGCASALHGNGAEPIERDVAPLLVYAMAGVMPPGMDESLELGAPLAAYPGPRWDGGAAMAVAS